MLLRTFLFGHLIAFVALVVIVPQVTTSYDYYHNCVDKAVKDPLSPVELAFIQQQENIDARFYLAERFISANAHTCVRDYIKKVTQ